MTHVLTYTVHLSNITEYKFQLHVFGINLEVTIVRLQTKGHGVCLFCYPDMRKISLYIHRTNFHFIIQILPVNPGAGVYSVSNRNEYQRQELIYI
jgi:hypothetical protein